MAKPRFPLAIARPIAAELCALLAPWCERLIVAGSLRRQKPTVGDVEILYIGKVEQRPDPDNMFGSQRVNLADEAILRLESEGIIARRRNVAGSTMYGPKNKLVRHRASGIPVDLFAATVENWFNYLVCRTGPAESNTRIASAAIEKGWKWNPYGVGFTSIPDDYSTPPTVHAVTSEEEVFTFVGLPYREPEDRE